MLLQRWMLAKFKNSVFEEKTNQQKWLTFRDVNFSFEISQYQCKTTGSFLLRVNLVLCFYERWRGQTFK